MEMTGTVGAVQPATSSGVGFGTCNNADVLEGYRQAYTKYKPPVQAGCPNCGYCPHCGRSYNYWPWPHQPSYPWQNPITYTTTTSAAQEGQ
jgi:hypothetical protein